VGVPTYLVGRASSRDRAGSLTSRGPALYPGFAVTHRAHHCPLAKHLLPVIWGEGACG